MEVIRELINLVVNQSSRATETLQLVPDQKGTMMELFENLEKGNWKDDETAAEELLGVQPTHYAYRRVKNKLKKSLLNAVFFLPFKRSRYNAIQRAYYQCHKDWAAIKFLIGRSAFKAAFELSKELLRKALRYDFTDIVVMVLPFLIRQYGIQFGDNKRVQEYTQMADEYLDIFKLEIKADRFYALLANEYAKSATNKPEIFEVATSYYQELSPFIGKIKSYKFHILAYMIGILRWMSVNNYHQTADECLAALNHFDNLPYDHKNAKAIFLFQLIICCIHLRRYELGEKSVKRCMELLDEGSTEWFRANESYLLLSLHSEQYESAIRIYHQTSKHKTFQFLFRQPQERWFIYEAYIQYLSEIKNIPLEGENGRNKKSFKLGKFLNQVPVYSNDKRGMNINILIIQTLFLIHQKKYHEAIERIEALQKYTTRYLRKNESFRSNCFIKMLVEIPKQNFHREAVKRHVQKFQKKLASQPYAYANQATGIEIIPYENLWELVIDRLENKIH